MNISNYRLYYKESQENKEIKIKKIERRNQAKYKTKERSCALYLGFSSRKSDCALGREEKNDERTRRRRGKNASEFILLRP